MSMFMSYFCSLVHSKSGTVRCRRGKRPLSRTAVSVFLVMAGLLGHSAGAQDNSSVAADGTDPVLDLDAIERVDAFMAPELETESHLTFDGTGQGLVSFRQAIGVRGASGAFWRWKFESQRSRRVAPARVGPAVPQLLRSPDGTQIVVSNAPNGRISVLDAQSLKPMKVLSGHKVVHGMSLSPNGQWLASIGRQGNLLLWDLGQDQPLPRLLATQLPRSYFYYGESGDRLTCFVPMNDGSGVLHYQTGFGDERQLRLFPAGGGEPQMVWRPEENLSVNNWPFALSPDGSLLFLDGHLIDVNRKLLIRTLPFRQDMMRMAAWSPDGNRLAVQIRRGIRNNDVLLWNVTENRQEVLLVNPFENKFEYTDLEFSPTGNQILAEGDSLSHGRFSVWNVPASVHGESTVAKTKLSMTAPAGSETAEFSADIPEIQPGLQIETSPAEARTVEFLDDDRVLTSGLIIDLTTALKHRSGGVYGNVSQLLEDGRTTLAFDSSRPYARYVLDGERFSWQRFRYKNPPQVSGSITHVEATPDGRFVATFIGYGDKRSSTDPVNRPVHVWQFNGQQVQRLGSLPRPMNAMTFSNRNFLITGGDNGDVAIWQPQQGREVLKLDGMSGRVRSVDISDDNSRIAAAADEGTGVWTVGDGDGTSPRYLELSPHGARYVRFSPSAKHVFVFYSEGSPELIDTETGRTVARFEINGVTGTSFGGCAFSPDERQLVIAGSDHGFRGIQVYTLP